MINIGRPVFSQTLCDDDIMSSASSTATHASEKSTNTAEELVHALVKLVRQEIRADPRSQELASLKAQVDGLHKIVEENASLANGNFIKFSKGHDKHTADLIELAKSLALEKTRPSASEAPEEMVSLKRKLEDVDTSVASLKKQSLQIDADVKAIRPRLAAIETRFN